MYISGLFYLLSINFDDDRVTQKDKPVAVLPMCIMKTFQITYHSSSYSRYEYISQYDITYHSLGKIHSGKYS